MGTKAIQDRIDSAFAKFQEASKKAQDSERYADTKVKLGVDKAHRRDAHDKSSFVDALMDPKAAGGTPFVELDVEFGGKARHQWKLDGSTVEQRLDAFEAAIQAV